MDFENSRGGNRTATSVPGVSLLAVEQAANGTAYSPLKLAPHSPASAGFLYSVPSPTPTPTPPRTSLRLRPDATGTGIDDVETQSTGFPGNRGKGFGGGLDFWDADEVGSPPESLAVPVSRHSEEAGCSRQPSKQKIAQPGLFTALLDNISLSQMPSQGTQEGVVELDAMCSRNCVSTPTRTVNGVVSREGRVEPADGTECVDEGKTFDRDGIFAVQTSGFLTPVSAKHSSARKVMALPKGVSPISRGIWSKRGLGLARSLAPGSDADSSPSIWPNNNWVRIDGDLCDRESRAPGPVSVKAHHDGERIGPAERREVATEYREASSPQTKATSSTGNESTAVVSRLSSGTANVLNSAVEAQSEIATEPVDVGRALNGAEKHESGSKNLTIRVHGDGSEAPLVFSNYRDQGPRSSPSAAERRGTAGYGREDSPARSPSSLHLSLSLSVTSQEKCPNAAVLASRVATPDEIARQDGLQLVSNIHEAQGRESTGSDLSSLCLSLSLSQQRSNDPATPPPEFQSPAGGAHGNGSNTKFTCKFGVPRSVDLPSEHNSNSSIPWSLKLSNLSTSPHREQSPRHARQDAPALDHSSGSLQSHCENAGVGAPREPAPSQSDSPPAAEASIVAGENVDQNSLKLMVGVSSRDTEGDVFFAGGASDESEKQTVLDRKDARVEEENDSQGEGVGSDFDDGLETDCDDEVLEKEDDTQIEQIDDLVMPAIGCSDPDDRRGEDSEGKADAETQGSSTCLGTVTHTVADTELDLGQEIVGIAGQTEGSRWVCEEEDGYETEIEDTAPPAALLLVGDAGEIHSSIDGEIQTTAVDTACLGDRNANYGTTNQVVQMNQHFATHSAPECPAADPTIEDGLPLVEILPLASNDRCDSNGSDQENRGSARYLDVEEQASAKRNQPLSVPQGIVTTLAAAVQNSVEKPVASNRQQESRLASQGAAPQLLGEGVSEACFGNTPEETLRGAPAPEMTKHDICNSMDGAGGSRSCPPTGERCTDLGNDQRKVPSVESGTRPEPEYFQDGATAKGRTNWGAGVYGRGDAVSYAEVRDFVPGVKSAEAGCGGVNCAIPRGEVDCREAEKQAYAEPPMKPSGASGTDLSHAPAEEVTQDIDIAMELPMKDSRAVMGCPAKSETSTSKEANEANLPSPTPRRQTTDKLEEVARSSSRRACGGWLSSRRPTAGQHMPPTPPRESDETTLSLADAETLSPEYFHASRGAAAKTEGTRKSDDSGGNVPSTFGIRAAGVHVSGSGTTVNSKTLGVVESRVLPAADERGSLKDTCAPVTGWLSKRLRRGGGTKDNKRGVENAGVQGAAKRGRNSRDSIVMSCDPDAIPGIGMSTPNRSPDVSDEIEDTPPQSTKKKRLKARKLAGEFTALMNQLELETEERAKEDSSTTTATAVGALAVEIISEAMRGAVPHAAFARDSRQVGAIADSSGAEADATCAGVVEKEDQNRGCVLPPVEFVGKAKQDYRAEQAAPSSTCRSMHLNAEDLTVSGNTGSSVAQENRRVLGEAEQEERENGKEVRRAKRACGKDVLAHEEVANSSAAEPRMKGRMQRRTANADTSAKPAAGLSREQRASKLAAWNRWKVARKTKILSLISKLEAARMEQHETDVEILAEELISAENETFAYNPVERRDKTHPPGIHPPASKITSLTSTRGEPQEEVAATEEQRYRRRSHHAAEASPELGDRQMSLKRQEAIVPFTMVSTPSFIESARATTMRSLPGSVAGDGTSDEMSPGKKTAARVGRGADEASPAPKEVKRSAAAGSWRENANRCVDRGGSNVQVGDCNNDEGCMSRTSGSAGGSEKSMSRTKPVSVQAAKKPSSDSTETCSRRTDAVPECVNTEFSLKCTPDVVAKKGCKKRKVDLELEGEPSGMTKPHAKKKRGDKNKKSPPKNLASRCDRKKSGAGSCRSSVALDDMADVSSSVNPSGASTIPQSSGEASHYQSSKDIKCREHEQQPRFHAAGHSRTTSDVGKTTQGAASPKSRARRGQEMIRRAGAQSSSKTENRQRSCAHQGVPRGVSTSINNQTFLGLRFVITGFLNELKIQKLERAILQGGGLVQEDLTPPLSQPRRARLAEAFARPSATEEELVISAMSTCKWLGCSSDGNANDVVVAISHPLASREAGYVLALSTGTPLLHHLWISDSLAQGRALPAAPYLLPGVRETSKRRQAGAARAAAAISAPAGASILRKQKRGAGNSCSRESVDESDTSATAASAITIARAAVAKVVAKPGTPLNGMSVGVAHACPDTCGSWVKTLKCAGAQTVREILASVSFDQGYRGDDGDDRIGEDSPARSNRPRRSGRRGGERRLLGKALRSLLADLDCVLCDYPGAWGGIAPRSTVRTAPGVVGCVTSPAWLGRLSTQSPQQGSTLSRGMPATSHKLSAGRRHSDNDSAGEAISFLYTLVEAAKLEGVPVVSLSWAAHCVMRGTRIKWQSSPEYLAPFTKLTASTIFNPQRESTNGRLSGGGSVLSFDRRNRTTSILVYISRQGVRYEVNDHARFDNGIVGNIADPTDNNACKRNINERPPRSFLDSSKEKKSSGVARIVSLSRADNGAVFVTLEPLQASAAAVRTTGNDSCSRMLSRGDSVVVAGPSMDSSLSRGRARRANQLLTTVASCSRRTTTCQRLNVEASCLRGRVTVLKAREFDIRRGYCVRDPDVYVCRVMSSFKSS